MKLERAELNQKIISRQFKGVGIIKYFRMSSSGLNRCYVDVELENGNLISVPLDAVAPF